MRAHFASEASITLGSLGSLYSGSLTIAADGLYMVSGSEVCAISLLNGRTSRAADITGINAPKLAAADNRLLVLDGETGAVAK